jgi:F-type H+-transporting ATPase subunit delta
MAARLSRRKITRYVADQLATGTGVDMVVKQLAAFLIDTGRTTELELMVRDIEYALAGKGIVLAHVTSATELTDATRTAIRAFAGDKAQSVQLSEYIDPSVLGGVKVDIPGRQFDGTIARRLTMLKTNFKK